MDPRAHVEQRLRQERDAFLALCQDLIRIPSENPSGDTTAIFSFVTDYLSARGVNFEIVAPRSDRPNLIATIEGGEPGKHLVYNSHLDTFPAGDRSRWSDDPFSGAIRDGKIFGRGITDMKGANAASIFAFLYLSEIRQHLKGKLTLTLVSDEVSLGPWGAEYLVEHYPDALGDCMLSGEPGTPSILRFGDKGLLRLEISVRTKGGHGGYIHVSPNSIAKMLAILQDLQALGSMPVALPPEVDTRLEAARATFDAQLGPGATDTAKHVAVNFGLIEGGTAVNMIADHCRAWVDLRLPFGLSTGEVLARVDEAVGKHPEATYTLHRRIEPSALGWDHEFMSIVQRNAEVIRDIRPLPGMGIAMTDCRLWRFRGVPSVVYGPVPYNSGAADEYLTLEDLFAMLDVHTLASYDYLTGAVS